MMILSAIYYINIFLNIIISNNILLFPAHNLFLIMFLCHHRYFIFFCFPSIRGTPGINILLSVFGSHMLHLCMLVACSSFFKWYSCFFIFSNFCPHCHPGCLGNLYIWCCFSINTNKNLNPSSFLLSSRGGSYTFTGIDSIGREG